VKSAAIATHVLSDGVIAQKLVVAGDQESDLMFTTVVTVGIASPLEKAHPESGRPAWCLK
jgi:hypothetical protein